ncbi:hypothetical protein A3A84_02850 [Candidatus Collierbacteria bacterium RIFCSPLOWO2_01_FULL_50_23]|uniref:Glycosyl hydrolases family 39 N-terminal catalytic domain-containing protein n=1 Tax=Candidatus Collierbacteria bacterium RIFCSPHIGHO2_01_FULL_50_25 TaxID=1817722 RepID=A0A1F5EUE6_9BACT|nr:MAG: hypothetical protein A2703_01155 [Candidatus Collierbacteria bacterium RIFCSPHIGHO2_01_FULL_50_25]OGD75005.1 MAG: hypothetical protein A3A84_02850 [Candidatus Collierbacteria bacterium RIFCSPLOWO2_01_FULL_50_23]
MGNRFKLRQFLPLIIGLIGIISIVVVIPAAVRYVGRAAGVKANLVVDYDGVLGQMPTPWRNLAQGGEEPKAMLGDVILEVKALKPEYIRLDHIYDAFNVVTKEGGQLKYNWSGLDVAVDQIIATGAKPMLALSYMPVAISKTGSIIDQPADWNDWGSVVAETVEHYSGKNNKNLTGVIYEVWNEPDLFGSYKTYGDKNYLTMYQVSARAAARVSNVNSFEIGGAAVTALYQNWLERLIKFVDANNLRLDFMSWHRYSTDIERFEKDANTARGWAARIPALINLKFYVTEWGHDSANEAGYDTKFGAIHTLAASRVMMAKIQRAFVFEIKDGPGNEKFWGRWGILTHEKFGVPEKKPRYQALLFLNTLGPFRISLAGEGSWVKGIASTDNNGNISLMVVNYDAAGTHSEAVSIFFDNLPKGNFRYQRRNFLGSAIAAVQVATTAASWKTTEFFAPNSAAMITLDF